MDFEQRAVRLCEKAAADSANLTSQSFYRGLAGWEGTHYRILDNSYDYLANNGNGTSRKWRYLSTKARDSGQGRCQATGRDPACGTALMSSPLRNTESSGAGPFPAPFHR
jgi:hypothetical protein